MNALERCDRRGWLVAAGLASLSAGRALAAVGSAPTHLSGAVVDIVVPYAPGGGSDLMGRLVADAFQAEGMSRTVVLNQPGLAGTIGSKQVALSAPDGRTWLISGVGSHVIAPQWQTVGYDSFRDFDHLSVLGGYPSVLVANARKGIRRIQDIAAHFNWASPGTGSHGHLLGTLIMQNLGVNDAVHVPYKGGAMALQDLLGGHVDLAVMTLPSFMPHVRNPDVVALAITTAKRTENLLQVPTFAELGFQNLTAATWFGLSAPRGLGNAQALWANKALIQHYGTEPVKERLRLNGVTSVILDPEQALVFMQKEWSRWGKVISSVSAK
jgi:tripartite-type tricarboxylate transporter receptor subunit TctC